MAVQVRFFASLREQVGLGEVNLEVDGLSTARDTWNSATNNKEIPSNLLVAINQEYVDMDAAVSDNDEVAFFPPVTGG